MRLSLIVPLLAASMLYSPSLMAQSGPGCGPANIKFDVSTTKSHRPSPAPETGKALVFFLQDDLKDSAGPRPTTRFAIDGTWVGATHANSYFYAYVDPGEHHVCANWQSFHTFGTYFGPKRSTAAAHFTAEAGKSYYFRAQDFVFTDHTGAIKSEPEVLLSPLDSDEAQVIMNSFAFSSFRQKK